MFFVTKTQTDNASSLGIWPSMLTYLPCMIGKGKHSLLNVVHFK